MEGKKLLSNLNRNRYFKLLLLLFISFLIITIPNKLYKEAEFEEDKSIEEIALHFEQRIPALMLDYDIPGVNIAILKSGDTVLSKSFGYANQEEKRELTLETVFSVGSISKSLTAWGIMKLVEDGKITLDDPLQQYLKDWQMPQSDYPVEEVTIRHLLSNSSGMPLGSFDSRFLPYEDKPTLRKTLSEEAVLRQRPGDSFYYSNVGFNLLELLIEEITDRDFSEYMKEEIFMPLSMHNSSFDWQEKFDSSIVMGYDINGNSAPPSVYPEKASGGLITNIIDIERFLSSGRLNNDSVNYKVLNEQAIKQMHTPMIEIQGFYGMAFDSYGLGHFLETLDNGQVAISHGGQGYGIMTHYHFIPETGDGIIILTNSQRSWPFFAFILRDWAKWSGYSSLGMSQIILGKNILWILIAGLCFFILWKSLELLEGLIEGSQHLAPLSNDKRYLRLFSALCSLVLISGLFWAINQDYLFISTVFPIASVYLGIMLIALAILLGLMALFSKKES